MEEDGIGKGWKSEFICEPAQMRSAGSQRFKGKAVVEKSISVSASIRTSSREGAEEQLGKKPVSQISFKS